jgi:hypothetical protein
MKTSINLGWRREANCVPVSALPNVIGRQQSNFLRNGTKAISTTAGLTAEKVVYASQSWTNGAWCANSDRRLYDHDERFCNAARRSVRLLLMSDAMLLRSTREAADVGSLVADPSSIL